MCCITYTIGQVLYIYTSETPAFGGISLDLRGSAASVAAFGKPPPSAAVNRIRN